MIDQLYCSVYCADQGEPCERCLTSRLRHQAWSYLNRVRWDAEAQRWREPDEPNPFDGYDPDTRKAVLTCGRDRALYRLYLRSEAWRVQRYGAIARAGGACERCGRSFLVCLDVHHLHYDNLGAELEDDLMALCRDCHEDADRERRAALVA